MRGRFARIWSRRRYLFYGTALAAAAGILLIWTLYLWWRLFIYEPAPLSAPVTNQETAVLDLVRRLIDGVLVRPGQATSSLWAVMIDNFPESRPAAGLHQASLVWEAPVEGGLSRFLAVFPADLELAKIGPVRSARPYFIEWSQEVRALYAHVGGSAAALRRVRNNDVFNLNEFYRGEYFWRDPQRPRPYNVYTSSQLLNQALVEEGKKQNWQPSEIKSWLFKDEAELEKRGEAARIALDFGKVQVEWRYNREKNVYERFVDGENQKDESSAPLAAKNVIVQFVKIQILDEAGRRFAETVGRGRALILRDGQKTEGSWRKTSLSERTRFFDPSDEEMKFNAGTTWIEVLDAAGVSGRIL